MKVVRVEITRDDGSTITLEGAPAEDWDEQIKAACLSAWNHGVRFKVLPWVVSVHAEEEHGHMKKQHPSEQPAKRCPECGETIDYGHDGRGQTAPPWKDAEAVPHPNLKDCIRSLRARLEQVEMTLERHNF